MSKQNSVTLVSDKVKIQNLVFHVSAIIMKLETELMLVQRREHNERKSTIVWTIP